MLRCEPAGPVDWKIDMGSPALASNTPLAVPLDCRPPHYVFITCIVILVLFNVQSLNVLSRVEPLIVTIRLYK